MAGPLRGAWSDALPFGADKQGPAFPSYDGGAFVQETQSIGGTDETAQDILGKVWGSISGVDKVMKRQAEGGAAAMVAKPLGDIMGKVLWFGLGAIFLAAGVWGLMRGTGVGGEIAAGIKEGIAEARA